MLIAQETRQTHGVLPAAAASLGFRVILHREQLPALGVLDDAAGSTR